MGTQNAMQRRVIREDFHTENSYLTLVKGARKYITFRINDEFGVVLFQIRTVLEPERPPAPQDTGRMSRFDGYGNVIGKNTSTRVATERGSVKHACQTDNFPVFERVSPFDCSERPNPW